MGYKKVYKFIAMCTVGFVILSSCTPSTPNPGNGLEIVLSQTLVSTETLMQTATPSPTITPTITPIPTLTTDILCPKLQESLPSGITKGIISYWPRHIEYNVILNLENGERTTLPDRELANAIVSLDRNKIAYRYSDPNGLGSSIIVHILDEQDVIKLPWPSSRSGLTKWQDNEHLLFSEYSDGLPNSHRVLNPFTGETIFLASDYQEISHSEDIYWDGAGPAVYDQTLEYVVYAAWNEEKNEHAYVLWHIPSQTQLASTPGNSYGGYTADYRGYILLDGVSYNPPAWSTDDMRVAVISSSPSDDWVDEIFTVDKEGDIQQLTEFSNQFEHTNIRTLSWSPDGKQIAFFITTEPGPLGATRNEQLAILDIEKRKVMLYCLEGDTIGTAAIGFLGREQQIHPPLWSIDSMQIILENRYEATESRLILLDIPSNTAYEIGQNMQPFGWMLSVPK